MDCRASLGFAAGQRKPGVERERGRAHHHKIFDALDLSLGYNVVERGERVRAGLLLALRPGRHLTCRAPSSHCLQGSFSNQTRSRAEQTMAADAGAEARLLLGGAATGAFTCRRQGEHGFERDFVDIPFGKFPHELFS